MLDININRQGGKEYQYEGIVPLGEDREFSYGDLKSYFAWV